MAAVRGSWVQVWMRYGSTDCTQQYTAGGSGHPIFRSPPVVITGTGTGVPEGRRISVTVDPAIPATPAEIELNGGAHHGVLRKDVADASLLCMRGAPASLSCL